LFDVGTKLSIPITCRRCRAARNARSLGEKREYLVLRLATAISHSWCRPTTQQSRLREVINDEEWRRSSRSLARRRRGCYQLVSRYKNHVEKLKSGDIYQVAEVVRNLSIRDKDRGLSAGEKRMLTRARRSSFPSDVRDRRE